VPVREREEVQAVLWAVRVTETDLEWCHHREGTHHLLTLLPKRRHGELLLTQLRALRGTRRRL
jgi:hypothetical protein